MDSFLKKSMILCGILGSMAVSGFAQESEADLQRQIKKVEAEIQSENNSLQQQRDLSAQRTARLTERLNQANAQLAQIRSNNQVLASQVNSTKAQNQNLKGMASAYELKKQALSRELAKVVDQIAATTSQGFPNQKNDRLARLNELKAQLNSGSLSPEEGMNRLWTFVLERNRQAAEAETWPGSYAVNGANIPGRYVRLGAVFQAFMNDDGSKMFYMTRVGQNWIWQEVGAQKDIRAALQEAFAVAESKQSPKLVRIPVFVKKETR